MTLPAPPPASAVRRSVPTGAPRPAAPSLRLARPRRIAIIGTVGLPARYGGFETLAEQLVRHAARTGRSEKITVWCSARACPAPRPDRYLGAHLRYLPLRANGAQSVPYDALALIRAARGRDAADAVLLLGAAAAGLLPVLRATSATRVVVNPGGREWARAKWGPAARALLRWSEGRAVRGAHAVVADNPVIADDLARRYGCVAQVIAYGGDQALATAPGDISDLGLPARYALAIARAEPENNLQTILNAFAPFPDRPLVVVANWRTTPHGRSLRARYGAHPQLHLVDAIHDPARLRAIRDRAWLHLHGHSAGGTNPALVEAMWHGRAVAVWDCAFNRATTDDAAPVFRSARDLAALVRDLGSHPARAAALAGRMQALARAHYGWPAIADAYFDLLGL